VWSERVEDLASALLSLIGRPSSPTEAIDHVAERNPFSARSARLPHLPVQCSGAAKAARWGPP